ncbi:MAG: nicotinate phosphoribosyltransferase [Anaerolineae bacterium]|nr:nicotinate phosphoribosyltransferase [Anaerolineae bacterium]
MSIFDHQRLSNRKLKLDIEPLRQGFYADKYFENVVQVLEQAQAAGYTYDGENPRHLPYALNNVENGDLVVEAQYFNRHAPHALVAGVDAALAMVRFGSGYFEGEPFVETWNQLDVEAVEDGVLTHYAGDPMQVEPVIKIRGRYRDFALLETTMLGVMTRATRIATNVYDLLQVCNGKPILFFPARFDLPEAQMMDGYAYWLAVQRYNMETGHQMQALASTDAQSAWWGGQGGGTVPHALVATFLGDTAEAMVNYARYLPVEVPRIALVDFNNDTVNTSLAIATAFWPHYRAAYQTGDEEGKRRWSLNGVRLDTGSHVRDVSMEPDGPKGVSARLVCETREALDHAWEGWDVPPELADAAHMFCHSIKIVVSGGFDRERIQRFEAEEVPVDSYGVGSSLLQNDKGTNTDYSMDIVRVKMNGEWVQMAKVGRQPCDNSDLQPVDLREVE